MRFQQDEQVQELTQKLQQAELEVEAITRLRADDSLQHQARQVMGVQMSENNHSRGLSTAHVLAASDVELGSNGGQFDDQMSH